MALSKKEIYERIARKEITVEEGMRLLQQNPVISESEKIKQETESSMITSDDVTYIDAVQNDIRILISEICKMDMQKIQIERGFFDMGLESSHLMEIVKKLENKMQVELYPTLLFEYTNIKDLADYLTKEFEKKYPVPVGKSEFKEKKQISVSIKPNEARDQEQAGEQDNSIKGTSDGIAIIGLAGKYPMADDIDEFWENLKAGKDCITEVPHDRWDWKEYYDADKNEPGTTYSKWGGFINDVDKFDPYFFNITPREASVLDPQEQLFLEIVWKTFEDAGYTRDKLKTNSVGIFVGIMWNEYQLFGVDVKALEKPNSQIASIANRVSYFFNFTGPSIALDTMCSSSLTAVHLACDSILKGESALAIAGGVNITIHPNKYLRLSQQHFVSSEGLCRAFGEGGDGYVPGEGVGSILLKPLNKAIADNDHIYGIIKSTTINHGGKASGFTVPNPNAQAGLIIEAIKKAQINPEIIGYMEAHGTGTSLGDPIEINGLTKAFKEFTDKKQFCRIGSVKSNIGHLESAAGIVAITKVLLQMQYRKLVPSIHAEKLNPNIKFQNTPFIVQRDLEDWNRFTDDTAFTKPLIAGVSSFGAGGSNAHVIIEEFVDETTPGSVVVYPEMTGIFVLSARNQRQLKLYAEKMLHFLDIKQNVDLDRILYVLQTGRTHFAYRLAVICNNTEELKAGLTAFLGDKVVDYILIGNGNIESTVYRFTSPPDSFAIGKAWINGAEVAWEDLYAKTAKKVSLPTYPFEKERCWIQTDTAAMENHEKIYKLHPLVHVNKSTLQEQIFETVFNTNDCYLIERNQNGTKSVPGTVYLEMGRAAAELSGKQKITGLKNIIWDFPLVVDKEKVVHIDLFQDDVFIAFEIVLTDEVNKSFVLVQGEAVCGEYNSESIKGIDIHDINKKYHERLSLNRLEKSSDDNIKIIYEDCFTDSGSIMCRMNISSLLQPDDKMILNPCLLYTIQALIKLKTSHLFVPGKLDELEIIKKVDGCIYVYIKLENNTFDSIDKEILCNVFFCDEVGNSLLVFKNFYLEKEILTGNEIANNITLEFYTRSFIPAPVGKMENSAKENILIFDTGDSVKRILNAHPLINSCLFVKPGKGLSEKNYDFTIDLLEYDDYVRLFNIIQEKNLAIHSILFFVPVSHFKLNNIEENLNAGVYPVFLFIKALLNSGIKNIIKILYFVNNKIEYYPCFYSSANGFFKSLVQENPNYRFKVIEYEKFNLEKNESIIVNEIYDTETYNNYIKYTTPDNRMIETVKEVKVGSIADKPLYKTGGVYLITGGAGALGFLFADDIARTVKANIVLTGRSELSEEKIEKIKKIEALGSQVLYLRENITDHNGIKNVGAVIRKKMGRIDGIIHSAGVIRDGFLINKSYENFKSVLAPKIAGTILLDELTKEEKLDFFILFSSITGVIGNTGQADYAWANNFMDNFAAYRESLRKNNKRHGITISINWPYWQTGGMQIDDRKLALLKETTGIYPLPEKEGIYAFRSLSGSGHAQIIPVFGNKFKMDSYLLKTVNIIKDDDSLIVASDSAAVDRERLFDFAHKMLLNILAQVTQYPAERIEAKAPFEQYGLDSIMISQFNLEMSKKFPALSKTLLFEYKNLKDLTDYFISHQSTQLAALINSEDRKSGYSESQLMNQSGRLKSLKEKYRALIKADKTDAATNVDIAVIGVSGVYPGAKNIDDFWENLKQGKDCVSEIPSERWDYKDYFDSDPEKSKEGKMYCKWGGFIEGADRFDPLFFGISPREAELIDPQERQFLQIVWHALEDAGYTREVIKETIKKEKLRDVGIFAGVTTYTYNLFGPYEWLKNNYVMPFSSAWSVANRVSYFFNFEGPSIPVDTACSSSLSAIHYACEAIRRNECSMAIAGGVNLYLHPSKYIALCQNKMLSPSGRCHTFGNKADGFVPGEGVGAVLLKPLEAAEKDGDQIYAVIKGTAVNHDGKTNGYFVPNPVAQANVILSAAKQSGIDLRTISYMEAHGTGTKLGDPIEITGLTRSFNEYTEDKQFCSIGSAKSNIGHLEAAAGIAGFTKILLQMKYKQIAPSLHCEVMNPNLDFSDTPFIVQKSLTDWPQPEIVKNGRKETVPRRAGISSFGAGGANAHIILEEYNLTDVDIRPASFKPFLFIFSARSQQSLQEYLVNFKLWIEKNKNIVNPENVAYTLQVGREAFDERAAVVARDVNELIEAVNQYGKSNIDNKYLFSGNVRRKSNLTADIDNSEKEIERYIHNKDWEKIAVLWIAGNDIPWQEAYRQHKPRRISLPTYVFSGERLWLRSVNKDIIISTGLPGSKTDSDESHELLFYTPAWKEREQINWVEKEPSTQDILIFDNGRNIHNLLSNESALKQCRLVSVRQGHAWKCEGDVYNINPDNYMDYQKLFSMLKEKDFKPGIILYFWNMEEKQEEDSRDNQINNRFIYTLFFIFRAISEISIHTLQAFYYYLPTDNSVMNLYKKAAMAFTKSLMVTMPEIDFSSYILERGLFEDNKELKNFVIKEFRKSFAHAEYLVTKDKHYIRFLENINRQLQKKQSLLRKKGIYLLTGGLGGIGLHIAQYLLSQWEASVILMGRSAPDEKKQSLMKNMNSNNRLFYRQGDVADYEQVRTVIAEIKGQFQNINGIIHAAGVVDNRLIIDKELKEFAGIMKPKIEGTLNLDMITREYDLDFFMLFSSVASVIGDMGQCDYSIANRFMDSFCDYREALRERGERKGRTISINWPLWKEGGMHINPAGEELYLKSSGQKYLEAADGIKVFETALKSTHSHITVFNGNKQIVDRFLENKRKADKPEISQSRADIVSIGQYDKAVNTEVLKSLIQAELKKLISSILLVDEKNIDNDENFSNYGFDSISLKDFADQASTLYKIRLLPTLLFSYSNINALQDYLITEYAEEINNHYSLSLKQIPEKSRTGNEPAVDETFISKDIKRIVSQLLLIEENRIDEEENISNLGFDSLSLKELADKINALYGIKIFPTTFFTYTTIKSLCNYLLENYFENIKLFYHYANNKTAQAVGNLTGADVPKEVNTKKSPETFSLKTEAIVDQTTKAANDVAIIGIAGIFPGSRNLDDFWEHLEQQDNLVTEIPPDRWDWREYYGDPLIENNKTYSKWGAFINDVYGFDPLFFKISPGEAEVMDPQHRLFLECAWSAMEDAGYNPYSLKGKNIGVFAGIQFNDYYNILSKNNVFNNKIATGTSHALLPNRISFLFNFHGPSMAIDTACSSSLVAFHQAVKSVQSGESECALAGGVALLLEPDTLIKASQLNIISPDGCCKTFDKDANGYVKGEGVQVFLLKPLNVAIRDKDHVYAVVKGTAVNHGGTAQSLTAPNSDAQADVIFSAYKAADIDPVTITYIETHGTGTELGDPVEVNGLKRAFQKTAEYRGKAIDKYNYCGLGSVKTNIGHLEPAAGTAGLMKIILAMQHKKLPGLVNFKEKNPYLELERSPFYLIEKTKEWERLTDEKGNEIPLRAGVSSFGFGGANAHVVVEECTDNTSFWDGLESNVFVLSAKNSVVLKQYSTDIINYLEKETCLSLDNVCYTLQTGRGIMDERLAFVCSSIDDVINKLKLSNKENFQNIYYGNSKINNCSFSLEKFDNLNHYILRKQYDRIAQAWVAGAAIEWKNFYRKDVPGKISLPSYPFQNKSYWIQEVNRGDISKDISRLHPVVLSNVSTLKEQKYNSILTGTEFFIKDYVVNGQTLIPAAVYLEMARVAGNMALEKEINAFADFVWLDPVTVNSGKELFINFYPGRDVRFLIYSKDSDNKTVLHCRGVCLLEKDCADKFPENINISDIKERCTLYKTSKECYDLLKTNSLNYLTGVQAIKEIFYNDNEIIAEINIPASVADEYENFVFNPIIMETVLQSIVASSFLAGNSNSYFYPFSLNKTINKGEKSLPHFAYIRKINKKNHQENCDSVFDMALLGVTKQVMLSFDGLVIKKYELNKFIKPVVTIENAINEIITKVISNKLVPESAAEMMEALHE